MFGVGSSESESLRARPWQMIRADLEQNMTIAREQLGQTVFAAAWTEGCATTTEQAITYALENADEPWESECLSP